MAAEQIQTDHEREAVKAYCEKAAATPERERMVAAEREKTGVFMYPDLGPVKTRHVSDGLSNTLLVAEKQADLTGISSGYDDNEPYANPGWDADVLRDAGGRSWRGSDLRIR